MDKRADNDHSLALSLGPGPRFEHRHRREPIELSLTMSISDDVSVVSSSAKREKDVLSEDIEVEKKSNSRASDELDEDGNPRKKLRLTKEQSALLEDRFKEHSTLNPKQKQALAKQLNLRPRQVEVWFQNRRARTRLKQIEVDSELLKKCCEALTEENRKLRKEIKELRAMKFASHPLYMQLPPTTLTMCPSCERVVGPINDRAKGTAKPHFFNPFTRPATY